MLHAPVAPEAWGGWMSDYDILCMPFFGTDNLIEYGRSTVLQGHIPAPFLGSKEEWLRIGAMISTCGESS